MANEKLISASDLTTAIRDDPYIDGKAFARVKRHIEEAPTVEVVRCKDCRHCIKDKNIIGAYGYCYHFGCYAHDPMVEADAFCSYGERRDDESKEILSI